VHERILHDYSRRIARDKTLPSPNDTCQTFEKAMAMVKDAAFLSIDGSIVDLGSNIVKQQAVMRKRGGQLLPVPFNKPIA
jgi:hypothetical protein